MAIRQYIGARYVPKFVGTWNANTSYEPLSIVQDANGNSFTSKKQVPAGTVLSNTEYWVQSANFNAQIAVLSDQLQAAGERIDALEATDSPITAYKNSKMIVFGDSNTIYASVDENQRWPQQVAARLGATLVNYGVNGATWQTVDGHTSILSEVNRASADSTAKLVFVMGGVNDLHYAPIDGSAFAAVIDTTLNAIHAKFPNALIVSIFDGGSQMPDGNVLSYARVIMRRASGSQRVWGYNTLAIPSCDAPIVPSLFLNQNHYSAAGHMFIAQRILSALYGGGDSYATSYRNVYKSFSQSSPTATGYYGCNYQVKTTIDPVACTRQDVVNVNLGGGLANVDSSKTSFGANDWIFTDIPMILGEQSSQSFDVIQGVKRESGVNAFSTVPISMQQNTPATVESDPEVSWGIRYGMPLSDVAGYSTSYRIVTIN